MKERHTTIEKDVFEENKLDKHLKVGGDRNVKIVGSDSQDVTENIYNKAGQKMGVEAGQEVHIKAGTNLILEASTGITLKVGGNYIVIGPSGVSLKAGGSFVALNPAMVSIKGTMLALNGAGAADPSGSGSGCSPDAVKPPKVLVKKADPEKPAEVTIKSYSPAALVLKQAAASGAPFCAKCAAAAALLGVAYVPD